MVHVTRMTRLIVGAVSTVCIVIVLLSRIEAAQSEPQTSGGLTVYFGIVPAEIIKGPPPHVGERPMHGRIPRRPHKYHAVAALFDAKTGDRISDASVTARISGVGMSGSSKKLEPMEIGGTRTYGTLCICLVATCTL
jgi:hypothetical protein